MNLIRLLLLLSNCRLTATMCLLQTPRLPSPIHTSMEVLATLWLSASSSRSPQLMDALWFATTATHVEQQRHWPIKQQWRPLPFSRFQARWLGTRRLQQFIRSTGFQHWTTWSRVMVLIQFVCTARLTTRPPTRRSKSRWISFNWCLIVLHSSQTKLADQLLFRFRICT